MTRAISLVGRTKSSIRLFIDSIRVFHDPLAPGRFARWDSFPSFPTTRLMRSISLVVSAIMPIMSFISSAILPLMPLQSDGRRTEKSPFLTAKRTCKISLESSPSPAALAPLEGCGCLPGIKSP
jgi:hypothetical protein